VPGGRAGLSARIDTHVVKPGDETLTIHAGIEAFKKFGTRFTNVRDDSSLIFRERSMQGWNWMHSKDNDDISRGQITEIWLRRCSATRTNAVIYMNSETPSCPEDSLLTVSLCHSSPSSSQKNGFPSIKGLTFRTRVLLLERGTAGVTLTNPDLLALAKRLKQPDRLSEPLQS